MTEGSLSGFNRNILVIDDDQETLDVLKLELSKSGYRVLLALNWEEIIDQVRRAHDARWAIDAIILDLMMPIRSGFDVLQSLQVMLDPMPPVVVLSALSGIPDQIKAREMGADKYLVKPTSRKNLLNALEEVLSQGRRSTWRDIRSGWRDNE